MNRTKNNLMIIIVLGIIAASVSIGSISLMSFANVVTNDNRQVLEYACRQNAETINTQLSETETFLTTIPKKSKISRSSGSTAPHSIRVAMPEKA